MMTVPDTAEAKMAATAVEAWDERWGTPEGRADWLVPHPAVAALVPVLKARGMQHVLDLGCGIGGHALQFAEHGFAVEAIDGAAAGLDIACREAAARGLRRSLRQVDADALPFADASFDYVLSWNGVRGDRPAAAELRIALRQHPALVEPAGLQDPPDLGEAPANIAHRTVKDDGPVASAGQLKKRAGRKSASSALCCPPMISSATAAPRNGDIVTPLWVTAI